MDAVLVGVLTAVTVALAGALWLLWVDPRSALAFLTDAGEDAWFDEHPLTVRLLRWGLGGALFVVGFLTGLATAFLGSTG